MTHYTLHYLNRFGIYVTLCGDKPNLRQAVEHIIEKCQQAETEGATILWAIWNMKRPA